MSEVKGNGIGRRCPVEPAASAADTNFTQTIRLEVALDGPRRRHRPARWHSR